MPLTIRLVNERFRLDKNVNKAFSREIDVLIGYYIRKKIPPEFTHGKSLFWAQIQDGRHYMN